jgi:hypothetical protein
MRFEAIGTRASAALPFAAAEELLRWCFGFRSSCVEVEERGGLLGGVLGRDAERVFELLEGCMSWVAGVSARGVAALSSS